MHRIDGLGLWHAESNCLEPQQYKDLLKDVIEAGIITIEVIATMNQKSVSYIKDLICGKIEQPVKKEACYQTDDGQILVVSSSDNKYVYWDGLDAFSSWYDLIRMTLLVCPTCKDPYKDGECIFWVEDSWKCISGVDYDGERIYEKITYCPKCSRDLSKDQLATIR